MNDEKNFPIETPDPDNQLPAPEEPAGQLEAPSSGGAEAFEVPGGETDDAIIEPIPPAEERRMSEDYIVTPPPPPPPPSAPPVEKKDNRTIWIVAIVALVLLCCCCLGLVAAGIAGWSISV
jgi:hypothetical protein